MANMTSGAAVHKQLHSVSAINEAAPASLPASEPAPLPAAQLDQFSGDPNFMTSLARGLAVIQAFSQQSLHLSITQLSKRTGLSRASVRRCLHTLSKLGFAGSDDGRTFYLLPRVLALGHSYLSSVPLATAAQPVLERLSQILDESSSIAVLDGIDIVYVARANVNRIMAIDLWVGTRLPAFCTSIGRVLLANLPPEGMESLLSRIEFIRFTDRTLTSVEQLRQVPAFGAARRVCNRGSGVGSGIAFDGGSCAKQPGPRGCRDKCGSSRAPRLPARHADAIPPVPSGCRTGTLPAAGIDAWAFAGRLQQCGLFRPRGIPRRRRRRLYLDHTEGAEDRRIAHDKGDRCPLAQARRRSGETRGGRRRIGNGKSEL